MSLAAPWALVGLALLPVLWWLDRRARRPPTVEVPSLLFLEPEARPAGSAVARRADADLVLALAAAAALVLAAAGPALGGGGRGRTVRLVVLGGAAGEAPGFAARAEAEVARWRSALAAEDRLEVLHEPAAPGAARPTDAALAAVARAGAAALRIVVADRLPREPARDVRWVALGDPRARNVGLVAAEVLPEGDGVRVFANLLFDPPAQGPARLALEGAAAAVVREVEPGADGLASAVLGPVPAAERLVLRLGGGVGDAPPDHLPADDLLALTRAPLAVRIDPSLPAAHAEAVRGGLEAVLGAAGWRTAGADADLLVTAAEAAGPGAALVLAPLPPDAAPLRAPEGPDLASGDPVARDLSAAGADLVYAPGAERPRAGWRPVLGRRVGDRVWPVVERLGAAVRFAPDPLQGSPAPVARALWPLLLENLVHAVGGGEAGAGYRRRGLASADTSRPGRDEEPSDPRWLAEAAPDRVPPERPLRAPLVAAALALLALLWARPALRRRGVPSRA